MQVLKKILLLVAIVGVLAFSGCAFAAVGGHIGKDVLLSVVPAPDAVLNAVGGQNVTVAGSPRELTSAQVKSVVANYGKVAYLANLSLISVSAPGVHVFGVTLSDAPKDAIMSSFELAFKVGDEIRRTASVVAAAVSVPEGKYRFLGKDGKELQNLPADEKVFVAMNFSKAGTYEPVIVLPASNKKSGDGGSGCDAGFSALGMIALGGLFLLKGKR